MAEEKKKTAQDLYKAVLDFYNNDGRTDEEFEEDFPGIYAVLNSPMDSLQRQKLFGDSLKNSSFLSELRDIDSINDNFDISGYEKESSDSTVQSPVKIGTINDTGKSIWDDESMDGVNMWYDRAKEVLDPGHKAKNVELYDIFNDDKLQRLQDMQDSDRDYWFTELLNGMGYPDNADGIEALSRDLQTVLTRKKNADFADKFGKAKAPLSFVFGNVFEALDDGRRPSIGDIGADAVSNFAWAVPGSNMIKGVTNVSRMAGFGKLGDVLANVEKAKTIPGKIGRNLLRASIAPTVNEAADYKMGTDTSEEKEEGLLGRGRNIAMNTAINWATPFLVKGAYNKTASLLGNFGLTPGETAMLNESVSDLIDYGSKQNTAAKKLEAFKEAKDSAEETVWYFAKRLGRMTENLDPGILAEVTSELPGRLKKNGTVLSKMILENDGNLPLGGGQFIGSFDDVFNSALLHRMADSPKSMMDNALPYLANYTVNRLGTSGIGGFIMNRFDRTTRPWDYEDKKK